MIKITQQFLKNGISSKKGYSHDQFRALGFSDPLPPRKGWITKLIGTEISEKNAELFLSLKNKHLNQNVSHGYKSEDTVKSFHKTEECKKIYTSKEWGEVANRVKERDGYRCVNCGTAKNLHVHHLIYEKDKEIWAVPLWYLVTLCGGCHQIEHTKTLIPPRKVFNLEKS